MEKDALADLIPIEEGAELRADDESQPEDEVQDDNS